MGKSEHTIVRSGRSAVSLTRRATSIGITRQSARSVAIRRAAPFSDPVEPPPPVDGGNVWNFAQPENSVQLMLIWE